MGPLTKNIKLSYEDYLELREKTDNILEYIDGIVYMSLSPSTIHQRISSKLHAKLYNLLEGKSCEVFHAPFDILLKNEDKMYEQSIVKIETGIVKSKLFKDFEVDIEELFK